MPPPQKLELILYGNAKAQQTSREGIYVLSNETFNDHPVWVSQTENRSIRFEKEWGNCWHVGKKENHGTRYGGLIGPRNNDLFPQEIKNGWRYQDGSGLSYTNPGDVVFNVIGKD